MKASTPRKYIIIQGQTRDGRKFRPSDWAERLCGLMASMDRRHRVIYSPQLVPFTRDGIKSVAVDLDLETTEHELYSQIMRFVDSNQLQLSYPEQDEHNHAHVA